MEQRALHFIDIPTRSIKPRNSGLTLARDYGIGYDEAAGWIEAVGAFIDYVKMRHIWVLLMTESETDLVRRKMQLYRGQSIDVFPGGIVFELAVISGAVERTFATLARLGFTAVELSENIVPLSLDEKLDHLKRAKAAGLKVLFEIGEKYPTDSFDVDVAAREIDALRNAGCDLLILEKSQLDLCLGPGADRPEAERLVQLVKRVGAEQLVFEAEAPAHQVWLLDHFGPEVNLGPNLDPPVIAKLEATRRTLSREGGYGFVSSKLKTATPLH